MRCAEVNVAAMNRAAIQETPEQMRREFRERIERMAPERLALLRQVFLQLEVIEATERLDAAFDSDAAAGRLEPARIAAVVREVRGQQRRGQ